ncbi:TIGR03767 family metallophosphoesterase [Streptomyces sp. GC420]|uniref:TIGR03767 family metallophosphoesterase n=1 Tax=Streptomyces sp. GC420 TaxID=2697568 RepID=UPI0014150FEA|nr:TIGR03767 family metallophosphoesterase [Streptomyces sp. GC420]NBM18032.1 TIGR03767 family metallophosphoesterase [Streptomyces sp. GC420]
MSRIRSAAALDRRSFLAVAGAAGAAAGLGFALGAGGGEATATASARASAASTAPPAARRPGPQPALAPFSNGTTLRTVATPRSGSGSGYRRLGEGPAWPRVVRDALAPARSGRADRRRTLTAFVQLTDLHITDVQHPMRYEFLRSGAPRSWRPHEALTVAGAVSLVERVNALPAAPATGAPLSFVMTTGDNTDNNSRLELDWFLTAMSGGRITPNSGDPHAYEGVQNSGLPLFWHPEEELRDTEKRLGFPRVDGLLTAALRQVNSPGLRLPWYSTIGNHDDLSGGVYSDTGGFFAEFAVGDRKLQTVPASVAERVWRGSRKGQDPRGKGIRELLLAHRREMRRVTPDERRAPFTVEEYVRAHLDPAHAGRAGGPAGHGYTRANLDEGTLHYSFRISDDVLGISLDTTNRGGQYTGSIGTAQLRWLERTLEAHQDDHVIVFSHHYSASMTNPVEDPSRPGETRHGGAELLAVLGRHRNVRAWANGHSHRNEITPHGTFWEITTASHVDHPQLARVIELVDNEDGTLSLFTTLIEASAPYSTDYTDLSQTGLASLYRELSYNARDTDRVLSGAARDRNTELLLKKG